MGTGWPALFWWWKCNLHLGEPGVSWVLLESSEDSCSFILGSSGIQRSLSQRRRRWAHEWLWCDGTVLLTQTTWLVMGESLCFVYRRRRCPGMPSKSLQGACLVFSALGCLSGCRSLLRLQSWGVPCRTRLDHGGAKNQSAADPNSSLTMTKIFS